MQSSGIGISHLPNQRYRKFCQSGINYNIMVIGARGAGKSTFINKLFQNTIIPRDILNNATLTIKGVENIEESNILEYDYRDALLNFQVTEASLADKRFTLHLTVTEVDNVGGKIDNTDCWVPIRNHIEDLFAKYYVQAKEKVKAAINDKRIHVCLYFIDGSGNPVKEIDMEIMKEVGKYCNLIPVISKSDVLLEDEMREIYEKVTLAIGQNNINIYQHNKDDTIKPPYFIVSDRETRLGKVSDDTDFPHLKEILIQKGVIDLIEATEIFYSSYRTQELIADLKDAAFTEEEMKISKEFEEKLRDEEFRIAKARNDYISMKDEIEEKANYEQMTNAELEDQ